MRKFITIITALLGIAILSGCNPLLPNPGTETGTAALPGVTVEEYDVLRATFTAYADQGCGLDVKVENLGDSTVPVTVTFGSPVYQEGQYSGGTKQIAVGRSAYWSFPGSRPSEVTVRIGGNAGVGWIGSGELEYTAACNW